MVLPIAIGICASKHKKHEREKKEKKEFEKVMLQKMTEDGDIKNFDDWKLAKKDIKELEKRKSLKLKHNDPDIR